MLSPPPLNCSAAASFRFGPLSRSSCFSLTHIHTRTHTHTLALFFHHTHLRPTNLISSSSYQSLRLSPRKPSYRSRARPPSLPPSVPSNITPSSLQSSLRKSSTVRSSPPPVFWRGGEEEEGGGEGGGGEEEEEEEEEEEGGGGERSARLERLSTLGPEGRCLRGEPKGPVIVRAAGK